MEDISPKYLMSLIKNLEEAISNEYSLNADIESYICKWHRCDNYGNENFKMFYVNFPEEFNLYTTLHRIDDIEILIKMAIDMGIDTPDFIPLIPTFKNVIKNNYPNAHQVFQNAFKEIEEKPDYAIGLANSGLESIIKTIINDEECNKDTLYKLTEKVLKKIQLYSESNKNGMPKEIRDIGSSLLNINKNIEALRSEKTNFHGKTEGDYIIEDPLYAYFIVNSIATIGLFLHSFYIKKLENKQEENLDDLPF